MNTLKSRIPEIVFIACIIFTFILSYILYSPPAFVSSDAPEDKFSAERAFSHTVHIAKKPHSLGTAEHSRVKEYIKTEIIKLGLEYGEQSTTAIYDHMGIRAGYVTNVFGILRGSGQGKKAVVFLGHYDSCPHTPGAADDGSAVVSMLEGARALTRCETLENDIIFLFTDGEESGLFGAKVFTEEHPLMDNVGLVINIEARGSSGPTLAYEFNEDNGWVVRELNRAMPRLFAASISYEVYKRMPNDTDFTMFRRAGISGINIAFIEDYVNYHSMTDSPTNLNLNSLQHHGDYIMASALHFGNLDLSETKSEDVIFFNWIGSSTIIYSAKLNLALIILVMVFSVIFFYFGLKKHHIRWGRILLGFLSFFLTLIIILFISWLIVKLIKKGYPHYEQFYDLNFYNVKFYFLAFSALSMTIFSSINILLKKYFNVLELFSGIIVFSLLLMWVMHVLIPTGSYLIIVPLIFLLSGGIITVFKDLSFENRKLFFFIIHFIVLFPVISLYLPYVSMFYVALGLQMIFGGLVILILLWGYLIVPITVVQKKRGWILPALALFLALTSLFIAHIYSKPASDRPLQTSLNYYFDADSNRAYWVSENLVPDAWNIQFFKNGVKEPLSEIYPHAERLRLKAAASLITIPSPEAKISSDTIFENRRYVELIITTERNAAFCEIYFQKDSGLIISSVNGLQVNQGAYSFNRFGDFCELSYHNIRSQPLSLSLSCDVNKQLELFITERSLGIGEMEGFDPMPEFIIPSTGYNSYQTIVKKTWQF